MGRFSGWTPEALAKSKRLQRLQDHYRDARWPLQIGSRIANPPIVGEANANDKPTKYRNRKTGRYASQREADRATDLRVLERAGDISDLREQVRYLLIPKQEGERACEYVADFVYIRDGKTVVEDVKCKATKTPAYVIKRKLMLMVHGIRVREIA